MDSESNEKSGDKSSRVKAVIQSYCDKFPEDAQRVLGLTKAVEVRTSNQVSTLRELHSEVHRMAGAAHCVGFREIGRELSRIESKIGILLAAGRDRSEAGLEAVAHRIVRFFSSMSTPRMEDSRLIERDLITPRTREGTPLVRDTATANLMNKRVIIIDDDEHVRHMVEETLRMMGVSDLLSVASGLEALVAFPEFMPDVVLTDWHMKPISGLQLLDMIRSGATVLAKDTPIVFFSNTPDRKRRMQVEMSGANRFLTKPVSPEILNRTLLQAVGETLH